MTAIAIAEVFAGIGGVTGGFLDAGGFRPVFLNDLDGAARDTFALNFPAFANRYHVGRVQDVTAPGLVRKAGGRVDGLLGCPPCEGMSQAGLRDADDYRNQLLRQVSRLVVGVNPKFFVLENVPSILRTGLYRSFLDALSPRYLIHGEVVNAAEYGIPQLRRRAVVLGLRKDLGVKPTLPRPTHGGSGVVYDYAARGYVTPRTPRGRRLLQLRMEPNLPKRPLVTLQDALDDLPPVEPDEEGEAYQSAARSPYQEMLRRGRPNLTHHRGWDHNDDVVAFLDTVAAGECPGRSHGGRSRNDRYYSQAYARLHAKGLARTITKNFHNPGSGRFTHYAAPRTLTVREALRLQGFPDSFRFGDETTASTAERLVGNAFPRPLARALGLHIRKLLAR